MPEIDSWRADLEKRVDDLQAAVAHRRIDAESLSRDLPCQALKEAIDHLQSAWFCIGEARDHIGGHK
jgi:hypothetical protein